MSTTTTDEGATAVHVDAVAASPSAPEAVAQEQSQDQQQGPGAYHSSLLADAAPYKTTAVAASQQQQQEEVAQNIIDPSSSCVVRLRGLPFSSTADDVRKFAKGYFFHEPDGILVLMHGERRGEGFIEFTDPYEAHRFQIEKHRQLIGERYIEVYMSFPEDMSAALADEEASGSLTKNPIVRLRGLPFAASDEDLLLFFSQCQDKIVNIRFVEDIQCRRTGDAFLELADEDAVSIAMTKHRLLMGTRYVEVSRTTAPDREAVLHVASRRGRGGAPAVPQTDYRSAQYDPSMMMPPMMNPLLFMPPSAMPLAGPDGLVTVQIGKEAAEQAAATQAAKNQAFAMMQSAMINMMASGSFPPLPNQNGHHGGRGRKNRHHHHQTQAQEESDAVAQEATEPADVGAYSSSRKHEARGGGGVTAPPAIVPPSPLVPPSPARAQSRYIVRVRGLPFSASEETVAEFFYDVNVQPQGVHMVYNSHDKPTGEAFVEVETDADVMRALDHNGGALGHRYIEVFKSGPADMQRLGGGPQAAAQLPPHVDMAAMGGAAGMFPPGMFPMFPPFGFPPPQWGWGYQ
ncbi:RNA-binding protein, putative [Bodo saltans]|uniref:RNA-binding protein, putative n=1 Tax=Bodo saltans TaxID=75058 RepID=A0A0S4JQ03_BODSA|nr:RNA-binding protein, putative [Bodo saltans]|eukprot:CUG92591.1 RNA-binding protein, putative [Bodo saltans]